MKLNYYRFQVDSWADLFAFILNLDLDLFHLAVSRSASPENPPAGKPSVPVGELEVLVGLDKNGYKMKSLKWRCRYTPWGDRILQTLKRAPAPHRRKIGP